MLSNETDQIQKHQKDIDNDGLNQQMIESFQLIIVVGLFELNKVISKIALISIETLEFFPVDLPTLFTNDQ